MKYKKTIIVMIGMSYAREWDLFIDDRIEIVNKGINGDITDNMLQRFDQDVIKLHPDYVLIWGFSNDITTGKKADIQLIISKILTNIQKMVDLSIENKITPILATQITISYKKELRELVTFFLGKIFRRVSYQDHANTYIHEVNHWLREYTVKNKIGLLDLEPLLSNRRGFRKLRYTQKDGSHVTPAGYQRLSAYTGPLIQNFIFDQEKK